MPTLRVMQLRISLTMHSIDNALKPENPKPEITAPSLANDAASRTDAALAVAKAHFIARGWRPLAIQPPDLQRLCEDVSTLLLMNDVGDTAWLSTRDWSTLANPIDAFRREMVCVRAACVNEAILVYDGDFPDNVVEVAAHEPSLKLIDAAALRSMSPVAPPSVAAAAMAPTRTQRLAHPARQAAHYLAQVFDTRPLAAAERYFQDKFAHRLRQLNGERRRLKKLSTALLILVGASLGFLAFNIVVMLSAPETGDIESRTVQVDPKPLPEPMPPPQGYVAQAAGVSGMATRNAYVSSYRREIASKPMLLVAAPPISDGTETSLAITGTGAVQGYEDVEQTQRRADDAMRVIAGSTQEVRAAAPSALTQNAVVRNAATSVPPIGVPLVRSVDPAMANSELSLPDPAIVD